MKWSTDEKELQKQVNKAFEELGFYFPTSVKQVEEFDEKFKDYPFKYNLDEVDPDVILKQAGLI